MISRDKLIETIRDDLENNLGLSVNTIVDISTFAKDLDEFKSLASIIEDEFQGLNTSFTNLDNTDGVNNINSNEADSNYTEDDIAEQQAILDAIARKNKEEHNRLAKAEAARRRELAAAAANKRARTSYTRTPNRLGSNNKNKKVNAKKKKTKKYSVADI